MGMTPGRAGRLGGGREWLECPARSGGGAELFRSSFRDGIVGGEGRGIGRKEAGFLHFEVEIEVHLRRFEVLFLQAVVFRLL